MEDEGEGTESHGLKSPETQRIIYEQIFATEIAKIPDNIALSSL
jgi:hypothetical protein